MRNVWKGLVVGGLTGVAAGFVLDGAARASKRAAAAGDLVLEHAPDAGRWVQSVSERAGDWLQGADVSEHVRSAARKLSDSEVGHRAAEATQDIAATARKVAATSHSH